MFIRTEFRESHHVRTSNRGITHTYKRKKTVVVLQCDACSEVIYRDKGSMDPKRVNNNYFHVCSNCDPKQFAQRKGVEQKKIWDMPADADLPIGKF
jgi:hypothetical protein